MSSFRLLLDPPSSCFPESLSMSMPPMSPLLHDHHIVTFGIVLSCQYVTHVNCEVLSQSIRNYLTSKYSLPQSAPFSDTCRTNICSCHNVRYATFQTHAKRVQWCGGPGQSMWDLWWTEWHWDMPFSRVFRCSTVSIIPPWHSIHIVWGMNGKPVGGRSSETWS
jgi:hypothetical protein